MRKYMADELRSYLNISLPEGSGFSRHRSDFFMLTFVMGGSMTYIVDDVKYVLNKNDGIFIRKGRMVERLKGNQPVKFVTYNFYASEDFAADLPCFLPNSFSWEIKTLVQMFPYMQVPHNSLLKQKLVAIFNLVMLELIDNNNHKTSNNYVEKIVKIIHERLDEKLTLQSISGELNLSKEYVSSVFKKEMGKTLTNYIHEQKMFVARDMIKDSNLSLEEISSILGFDNYNYFSRLFKRYFDRTPMNMRKKEISK